ncbi:permease [Fontisphaera persica]|uniref:permease n=1 Tax=Fontisphaera persica TaxID=2974023 RepID=UPI003CCD3D6E
MSSIKLQVESAGEVRGKEMKILAAFLAAFLLLYFLPVEEPRVERAWQEGLAMTGWYAREHVLLCLIPALFIAGGISVFVNQAAVMRYLGPAAPKPLAYGVASVSGSILAVCSCTVLPLFGGIWQRGAGLGPAIAFLYSGPAINILAVILTARVLGWSLGVGRAVGAVWFSVVIGLGMHLLFRREERARARASARLPRPEARRSLAQNAGFFSLMAAVLIFANWSKPAETTGWVAAVHEWKWALTALSAAGLGVVLGLWFGFAWRSLAITAAGVAILAWSFPASPAVAFAAGSAGLAILCWRHPGEGRAWLDATWALAKQIFPLLLAGVFAAGVLLGRPGHEGLIPSAWVQQAVGGNSLWANAAAAVVGAFMYFATLTEVPILQGLLGSGMGQGPALALLLAGPALSLPSMLVLRQILGTRKTVAYVVMVIVFATVSGLLFGALRTP